MKSTTEILNEVAIENGWNSFDDVVSNHMHLGTVSTIVTKAMQLYAQQFIDSANDIIGPASEILDENYDEDYENWWSAQEVNEF